MKRIFAFEEAEDITLKGNKAVLRFAPVYAMECWGPNNNGDAFPEEEIKKNYKTFYDAFVHLEHVRNIRVGRVVNVFYDDEMCRLIVDVEVDLDKLPKEAVERLKAGFAIGSSMGCVVPYDVCSVCGHISTSLSDKCEHLSPENKLTIDEETKKLAYMINYSPKWDDISIVLNPADVKAFLLQYQLPAGSKWRRAMHDFKAPKGKRYDISPFKG